MRASDKAAAQPASAATQSAEPVEYTYEVVHTYPHATDAFTEGLLFHDGYLLESTGMNLESTLRRVDLATGKVLKRIDLGARYFGEGLTVIGKRAFQLTWQHETGFIYDVDTFEKKGEFSYKGEGWGLTTDGKLLIMSDGTDQIRFIDPDTFKVVRTIPVRYKGQPVQRVNELEYVKGEIFANVWQTDQIIRIAPDTGEVVGVVDLSGILPVVAQTQKTDVLNGIAYDAVNDRLVVTGKYWPMLFEIKLKAK